MRMIVVLIILCLVASCGSKQPHTPSETLTIDSKYYLADSLYKYIAYTGLLDKTLFEREDYTQADDGFKKKFINEIQPYPFLKFGNIYPQYGCAYVAKQKQVGNLDLIVVNLFADDYGSLMLLVIDSNSNVVDFKELAGGLAAGPDEYEDRIEVDANSYSVFENASTIRKTQIREIFPKADSLPEKSHYFIDSINYRFTIKDNGKIGVTMLDSIRLEINKN